MVQEKMLKARDDSFYDSTATASMVSNTTLLMDTNFMFGVQLSYTPSALLLSDMTIDVHVLGLSKYAQYI